jgi:hypothetical protein
MAMNIADSMSVVRPGPVASVPNFESVPPQGSTHSTFLEASSGRKSRCFIALM